MKSYRIVTLPKRADTDDNGLAAPFIGALMGFLETLFEFLGVIFETLTGAFQDVIDGIRL